MGVIEPETHVGETEYYQEGAEVDSTMSRRRAAVGRCGGIGDNLVATSVLKLLVDQGFTVDVLTNDPFHVVFENNPYIDRLILLKREDLPPNCDEAWQQWWVRRSHEYDKFIHLSHSLETMLALVPAQTAFWWPSLARQQLCQWSYLERTHDIAGVPHDFNPGPRFYPTEDEWEKAVATKDRIGRTLIAWVISGSRIDKVYPQAPLAVARLIRETDATVVLFGASQVDFDMAKIIQDHVLADVGSLDRLVMAGGDSGLPGSIPPVRRSMSLLQICDMVIGPDTGLMWSVAMELMPKIVLLSHASAENITKHWCNTRSFEADRERVPCFPCHRLHSDYSTCTPNARNTGAACISDIRVGSIVAAALNILERR
jgi:ADP-heptose:LPS heptosyltransferase